MYGTAQFGATNKSQVGRVVVGSQERALQVYNDAFFRGFEYFSNTGNLQGDILEFGTYRGLTAHVIANLMKSYPIRNHLWLYDSFTGFPEFEKANDKECYLSKDGVWVKGALKLPEGFDKLIEESLIDIIPRRAFTIVKGFFEDTMDKVLTKKKAVLVHLDCDLYSSTKFVLDKLIEKDVLQDGTILYCDDYNCNNANPTMGQRAAISNVFNEKSRFTISDYISYGWHGKAFFIHDREQFVS